MSRHNVDEIASQSGGDITFHNSIVFAGGAGLVSQANHIGTPGNQGFGAGIHPGALPSGFSEMSGTVDIAADNYGNYQYDDGSVMVWIPAFYYKLTGNSVAIKPESDFDSEASANNQGYALHRAFKNDGLTKRGVFVDKYQCSNNGGVASSIKNGNPLSTSSAHNPVSALDNTPSNYYYGTVDAAKSRGSNFFCNSRFIFAALAMLSLAHGQAASSTTYCAWYDAAGITNFPKGCNDNALGDTNDGSISYTSDGYSNCGKTGSANLFSRTAHNGQNSGVVDLNGNMWEVNLGLTKAGTSGTDTTQMADGSDFYILKESVDIVTLTSGWDGTLDAWGDTTHLATLYDTIVLAHITGAAWGRFGSGSNQVLDGAVSGDAYKMTGAGIYTSAGHDASGTNEFGLDGIYEYNRANLAVQSGGRWVDGSNAGVWTAYLGDYRSDSDTDVGFRSACYSV
jgi:hypothetical protein